MTANLITLTAPRSAAAEAYRTLRTNLMFSKLKSDAPLHTIMLTSAADSEDKSAACANLAVAFAQAGNKVILVDADLRRPLQHDIWGIANQRGLMTLMQDDAALAEPPLVATGVDGLSVLPTGDLPPIPADVLSNPRLREVIGVLKARADYIIFDTAPVLAATDAALLSSCVDGVLLVVRAAHTRRDHVAQAKQTLERVNAHLIGSVLTNAPDDGMKGYN
ncbi:MAG: polysaccharide biosynthesis tyrosine autokinase [Anaerolineaceae bacterium]|nr:MAG: polysaccharide biosynthesis tyrosine autokinase [Anaerolineaceae bacterium]